MRNAAFLIAMFWLGLSYPAYPSAFVHPAHATVETARRQPTKFRQRKARLMQCAAVKKAVKKVSWEALGSFGAGLFLALSVVLSVGGLFLWPLLAVTACTLGILALIRIRENPGMKGRLLALLGLFLGGLGVILSLLIWIGFSDAQ